MNVREDLARQLTEQKRALKERLESSVQSEYGDEHENDIPGKSTA
jgi:hypothetical protein